MVKKQAFAVLVAMMSFIGSAFGLGLGDISVKSNLNDPLVAEIKLLQLQGLTAGEVLPTLASNDDFRRAGIERSFFLSNIQFRVKENESGDLVVTLTTKQAVREPFLNFLVELNWPGGRLLKEYTVLLDPPVFDTGLAVDALVVESTGAGESTIAATDLTTSTVIESNQTTTTSAVATPVAPREDNLGSNQYRVQRNDTLWEIALKVPDRAGYSPQQVMLAIQDLNPQAFLNGNINRVKAGSVLTLPDGRQIATRTLDEAIAEVQAQNRGAAAKLRSPVTGSTEVQLSATESTSSALSTGEGDKNPDGYLELTAESESTTTTASGEASATVDQLQNQLAVAEELNDQFERERDELQSRVQELQEQISIMERLLDVQNSNLAQVQEALTASNEATDAADQQDTATATTPQVTTPAADAQTQNNTVTPAQPAVTTPTPTTTTTPAPVQTAPVGFMGFVNDLTRKASDWVMGSTTNMAITGAALLLLILLPLYIRSKRQGSDQTLGEMNMEPNVEFDETSEFSADLDDDLLAEVEDEFDEEISDEPETLDAVVEAEMYMAYQKYDQAEEKLKEAFADHPNRTDVALKLLEVYAETGDSNAFDALEGRLSLSGAEQTQVAELRTKLPIGGASAGESDLDFMNDDLSLDSDDNSMVAGSDDLDLGADLDFDLDLNDADTATEGDSLDFDLDLEDDSADVEATLPASDDAMNLDLSTSVDAVEPDKEEEVESDLDFSLDLGDLDESTSDDSAGDLDFSLDDLETDGLDLGAAEETLENNDGDLDFSLDLGEEDDSDSLSVDVTEEPAAENSSVEMDIDFGLAGDDELDTDLDLDLGSLDELSLDSSDDVTAEVAEDDGLEMSLEDESDSLDIDMAAPDEMELDNDPLQQLANSLDSEAELEEDEFDFLSGNDEASTKLDLARAYIEMDDKEGARDILEEVASEGNDDQKAQAKELMAQL